MRHKTKSLNYHLVILMLISSFLVNQVSLAQEVQTSKSEDPGKVKLKAILTPPYIIGPGDQLTIIDRTLKDVLGQLETYNVTVSVDGYISIPLPDGTQENILAAGLTLDELSLEVRELFGKTLKNPLLFVQISRYRPINVYIGGEVVKPGVYKIETTTTTEKGGSTTSSLNTFGLSLTQAIQLAGGLKPRADITSITVTRGLNQEKKNINLITLLEAGDTSQDINLLAGDAIFVSQAKNIENQAQKYILLLGKLAYQDVPVSVFGEVKAGGNFVLPNDATLLDAIGKAGGLNEVGSLKKIRISRYDENGIYKAHHFNVHDLINKGVTFDQIALRPNDTIEFQTSKGKLIRYFFNKNAISFISAATQNFGSFVVQDNFFNRLTRGFGGGSTLQSKIKGIKNESQAITVIGGFRKSSENNTGKASNSN